MTQRYRDDDERRDAEWEAKRDEMMSFTPDPYHDDMEFFPLELPLEESA